MFGGEYYAILPFLICGIAPIIFGQLLFRLFAPGAEESRIRHAMITVALCWFIIPIIGAIPLFMVASNLATSPETPQTILNFQNPWNALFEAFSGFTSTGLSVGITTPDLPWLGKLVLMIFMWMGRLEIIPVLILITEVGKKVRGKG